MSKKFLTVIVALILVALVPTVAFAGSFTAGTWDEFRNAFDDEDDVITITLTGDITMLDELQAKEGRTYIINGKEYVLADVYLTGTGTVKADVKQIDERLDVSDNVTAEITTNKDANGEGGTVAGVAADDNAKVTINGDVKNVTDYSDTVIARDNAEITINGDVSGRDGDKESSYSGDGIDAADDSKVTVNGDVKGGDAIEIGGYAGIGVDARDNSKVTVNGNVSGGSGIADEDSGIMESPDGYVDGGDGVSAGDSAQVEVNGDVKGGDASGSYGYGGDGIYADENAKVKVNGDVTGGDQNSKSDIYSKYYNGRGGDGIDADLNANVEVNGDVKGGNANGGSAFAGSGIEMDSTANVKVDGDVESGAATGEKGIDSAGVEIVLVPKNYEVDPNPSADPQPYEDGSLYVSGCVKSNGTSAIEYFTAGYENLFIPDENVTEKIANNSDYTMQYMFYIINALNVTGEEEPYFKICDDLIGMVCTKAGAPVKDHNELSANEVQKYISQMTADQRKELVGEFANYFIDNYDVYGAYYVPDVTVWGLDSGDKASNVKVTVRRDFGEMILNDGDKAPTNIDLTDILGADVNYIIRVEQPENGSVSVDKETAKAGETVTIKTSAAEGYMLDKVYVNGEEIAAVNGEYSFVVEDGGHYVVSASFAKIAGDKPTDDKKADEAAKKASLKTGYESNMVIMCVVIAACVMGIAFVAVKRRKEK